MTKHDCENYATCANYAPKQPKAPEHVAGERCDAPVRCGYENDSIDHFEYTGEYGTAHNTWFLCFRGEIVYAHISFPDVWILRPVPKGKPEPKPTPRFKVGDHAWWDGRSNCNSSHGPAQRVKVVAVNHEYYIRYTNGTYTGKCYVPYNALTPDTRPRIKVTAIDKTSKLHKWHFYGEPDWKRIRDDLLCDGLVAAVVSGLKSGMRHPDMVTTRERICSEYPCLVVVDAEIKSFCRGQYSDEHDGLWYWFGSSQYIAALRDRIREHYKQEPTITTNAQGTKYVRADLPDKCDACAHEFAPKPAFKVGDWVAYDSVGAPFQYNDRYETHTVGLRPARLSDFEREVNGVRVLMRENDSETYELTLPRSSLHDSEAIIGYWVEIKAKGGAYQLAKALGLTIAPASVKE